MRMQISAPIAALAWSLVALAQPGAIPTPVAAPIDSFQVTYAAHLDQGDSVVNFTNTGTLTLPTGLTTTGNLCVNVYAFDPAEEMISCCSCLVTPNGLNSLSVEGDILSNTLTPATPSSVIIKLLATTPIGLTAAGTGGSCDASSPTATPAGPGVFGSLVPGMRGWGVTLAALPTNPATYGVIEAPLLVSTLSPAELVKLTLYCSFIEANGSGFGVCKHCRTGGLGGAKAD